MGTFGLTVDGVELEIPFAEHFTNLARINASLNLAAAQHYQKQGLTYIDVPEIVGITGACENVDTLFKIANRLDLPLFFTQTGQLALEQALQSLPGVYTVIHSGRDEAEEDKRHLRQFRLTEEEFDCTLAGMKRENYDEERMFEALLKHIQATIQAMISGVIKDHKQILRDVYKRDVEELEEIACTEFLRIKYEKAVRLLQANGFSQLKFGADLDAEHEAMIVSSLNSKNTFELPVFITNYPKEIKFFNMKVSNKDRRVVLSADLILPYAGEATGSAVREHEFARLNERLLTSSMYKLHIARGGKYEDFAWYLNIIKSKGTKPHAGYGIGNERVLEYLLGTDDIRNVSLFSLLNSQTGDWSKHRYGQAGVLTENKKVILLSIGKIEDKKRLLPEIEKLERNDKFVLYATQKTHYFLADNKIKSLLVHKISEIDKSPNIADLLHRRFFDLIINIPTEGKKIRGREFTDGQLIRKAALNMGVALVTDVEKAKQIINNLAIS